MCDWFGTRASTVQETNAEGTCQRIFVSDKEDCLFMILQFSLVILLECLKTLLIFISAYVVLMAVWGFLAHDFIKSVPQKLLSLTSLKNIVLSEIISRNIMLCFVQISFYFTPLSAW